MTQNSSEKADVRQSPDFDQPELDAETFASGATGFYEVMPSGSTRLPSVRCFVTSTEGPAPGRLASVSQVDVPVQRPVGMPFQGNGLLNEVLFPRMTIARLDDCICYPGGVIRRGGTVLDDSFNATWERGQHRSLVAHEGRWTLKAALADAPVHGEIGNDVLYLDNEHIDWFGHVIGDLLSRAWSFAYIKFYLSSERLQVICSKPDKDYVRVLLLTIGVRHEDLVFIDQPVLCRNLIIATKAFQIQEYVAPPAFSLWKVMRHSVVSEGMTPSRIYVSRRANPTRRLLEEEEIEGFFAQRGFFVLYPEAFTIHDQIRAFRGASHIAGCSGSNLFNLAFAGSVKAVFIMASPLLIHYSEQMFCAQHSSVLIDLVVGYVDERESASRPGYVHCGWHLDVSAVQERALQWLKRSEET